MTPLRPAVLLLSGVLLSACSPDEQMLRELSLVDSRALCNAYVDESRACMGFEMRCLQEIQGVCTRNQLLDLCLEDLAWSTCLVPPFEQCFKKDLCNVQDDGAVLPCFIQCMTESNQ